jgi:glutathione S-transferase
MKTMLLLKLAGLPYEEKRASPLSAPKRKLPYIEDDGVIVPDSTFIRFHIEKKYGIDFDAGLLPEQKAAAWSIEKMWRSTFIGVLLRRAGRTMPISPRDLPNSSTPSLSRSAQRSGRWSAAKSCKHPICKGLAGIPWRSRRGLPSPTSTR